MICQLCGQTAQIHLTNIINHKKQVMHLCEACARREKLLPEGPAQSLNLEALVQLVMGELPIQEPDEPDTFRLRCPHCGLAYSQFREDGRLGCPHDYDAFQEPLEPLLARIHRGTRYVGKTPVEATRRAELATLKLLLRQAVEQEHYEEAARLRDLIRGKEGAG